MAKIIRYILNGIKVCGNAELKDKEEGYELCNRCDKRNKDVANKNCHVNAKVQQLSRLFSITIPVFNCPSFKGEVVEPVIEDVKPQQTDPDSTEE